MAGPANEKATSLQDIIKRRQRAQFVGRDGQIVLFRENLELAPEDLRKRYVFNIHGDGGIGKTYLIRQLEHVAEQGGAVHSYVDESAYDIPETMLALAARFGKHMDDFHKTYDRYSQRREQLLRDPHAPVEAWGRVTRTMVKVGLSASRVIPGAAPVVELVDADVAADNVDRIRVYLSRKFSDSAIVKLLMNPVEELTSAFVKGLAQVGSTKPVVLFFDTYERTGPMLDGWLLDLLAERFGPLPPSIVFTIAGREPLDAGRWSDYLAIIAPVPLAPFTETEARQLLSTKGVTDETIIATILALSGRLPLLLAMLAEGQPSDRSEIGDPSGTAVERFLKWEHDPARRNAALVGALARGIDTDSLAVFVGEAAPELFAWLRRQPFVSTRVDRFEYHEVVRDAMLRLQRTQSPAAWADAHRRLAAAHHDWAVAHGTDLANQLVLRHRVEEIYHELCARSPDSHREAVSLAVEAGRTGVAAARRCAEALRGAGADAAIDDIQSLGAALLDALDTEGDDCRAYLAVLLRTGGLTVDAKVDALVERGRLLFYAERDQEAVDDLTAALSLKPEHAQAFALRGASYLELNRHAEALADLNHAIDLKPDDAWNLAQRGEIYRRMERHEEALTDFNRAIDLKPDDEWAVANRGETFHMLQQYDDALTDFNRAIDLNPDDAWALAHRGETHRQRERYDDALTDFNRAIDLKPDYEWALAYRGETHRQRERYDDALTDFNRAIDLKPNDAWNLAHRGETHRQMQQYDDALTDFNRAIDLNPNDEWAIANRGETHRQMQQYDDALTDFNHAIDLNPNDAWNLAHRGTTYRQTERYEEALADLDRAIDLNPGYVWAIANRGETYLRMGRLAEALADFDRSLELDSDEQVNELRAETRRMMERPDRIVGG